MAVSSLFPGAIGKPVSQPDYAMLLDIGCTKAVCFISRNEHFSDNDPKGHPGGIDVIGAAHRARRVPCASGIAELPDQKIIRAVISQAEEMAAQHLASLYVCVPGQHLVFRRYMIELAIKGLPVDESDIRVCLREGRRRAAAAGEIPLHVWPIGWSVDSAAGLRDPRGLRGDVLRLEFTSAACSEVILKAFRDSLARHHRMIAGFIAAPYASGAGMLLEEERVLGALYMDIGSHYTNYIIVDEHRIMAMGAVPVGGDLITKDIARAFSIPLAEAELLKRRHGTACLSPSDAGRRHEVPKIAAPDDVQVIRAEHLCEVIEARLHEIADLVGTEMRSCGINLSQIRRLVLGGGGSLIEGSGRSLGRHLGMTARTAHPLGVRDAPESVSGPAFATGFGMAACVLNPPYPDLAPTGSVDTVMAALLGDGSPARGSPEDSVARAALGRVAQTAHSAAGRVGLDGISGWLRTHF